MPWPSARAVIRFVLVFVVDFTAGLLLLLSLNGDISKPEAWQLHGFVRNTADLVMCSVIRICTLVIVGYFAAWVGTVHAGSSTYDDNDDDAMTEPLLPSEMQDPTEPPAEAEERSRKLPIGGAASSEANATVDKNDPQIRLAALQTQANVRRNTVLLGLFFFCTASQILVGAKAVSLHYSSPKREGPLLGLMVLCINLEIWLLVGLVQASTKPTGKRFSTHKHPLLFMPNVAAAGGLGRRGEGGWHIRCSECSNRLRGARGCIKCQYFLCQVLVQR
jgi:hypothetical protein